MDFTIYFIGLMLVFTGAMFIGLPLGIFVGRREMRREFAETYFIYPLPQCVAESRGRLENADILNAEIIDYREAAK